LYDYREILEHVGFKLGKEYLSRIAEIDPTILSNIEDFKQNDTIGNPRRYKFPGVGEISPTTLRYVSVAAEIRTLFGGTGQKSIVEIGAGYGGQCSILNKLDYFQNYTIYDLPKVQKLIRSYLDENRISQVSYPEQISTPNSKYDLVISNYAFSELPRRIQVHYLENVLIHSRNGYMIMNSGDINKTGRSAGKMTLQELLAKIPNARVLPEIPKTGPDNYVLVWTEFT
jgi:putative sugar O-methyltransferase